MVTTRSKTKRTRKPFHQPPSSLVVSATLVASNDDLLTQILLRLPLASILQFKSVSKHWRSLLTHPHFTHLYDHHLLNLPRSPGFFFLRNLYIPFHQNPNPHPFHSLDFYPDFHGIKILQSCNGLLLCSSGRGHARDRRYYVFNPTTNQFTVVPSVPGGADVRQNIRFMGLAFHRTPSAHYCYYYKLVCFLDAWPHEDLFQIQIYSSETGRWKVCDETLSAPYLTMFTSGVYWNQAIYWAPSGLCPSYFKVDVERVEKLPMQVQMSSLNRERGAVPHYFGECGGHLHLVERRRHGLRLDVYEMTSDRLEWFLKYEVELDELPVAYPEMIHSDLDPSSPLYYEFQVLDVVRRAKEEEEEAFMVVCIPSKIIRFNLMGKSLNQMFDLTNIPHGRNGHGLEAHRYIQMISSFH